MQLRAEVHQPRAPKGSDGSKNANKAESKEPGNIRALHIIEDIECHMATARMRMRHALKGREQIPDDIHLMARLMDSDSCQTVRGNEVLNETIEDLRKVVKQARIFLSYDMPKSALRDTECDKCNGVLVVAQDASSDVICVGIEGMGGCGRKYRRAEWARMLEGINALVDTLSAVIYTGRPVGTLHRWVHEGRVSRRGGTNRGQARWDLRELPQAIPGRPLPPPPPLPKKSMPTPLPTAHAPADSTPNEYAQGG